MHTTQGGESTPLAQETRAEWLEIRLVPGGESAWKPARRAPGLARGRNVQVGGTGLL